jgi:poly [ADP-ribose] polymerase
LPPKGKGKYTFIERSYEPDSSEEEDLEKPPGAGSRRGSMQSSAGEGVSSQLALSVQHLMELIFSQKYFKEVMADMNYDPEKLPLGKLSKKTLEQGYEVLKVSRGNPKAP